MYDNEYNRKIADEVRRLNENYVKNTDIMEGSGMSGGFLFPLLASIVAPAIIKKISGGSGFGAGTRMDTGSETTLGAVGGSQLGFEKYKKQKVVGYGKKKKQKDELKGEGILSDLLGAVGLGKKKRGRPSKKPKQDSSPRHQPSLFEIIEKKKRGRPSKKVVGGTELGLPPAQLQNNVGGTTIMIGDKNEKCSAP
jgi:hypothetical protein